MNGFSNYGSRLTPNVSGIMVSDGSNWVWTPGVSFNQAGSISLVWFNGQAPQTSAFNPTTGSAVLMDNSSGPYYSSTIYEQATPSTSTAFDANSAKYIVATGTITLTFTPTANKEWYVFNNDANTKTIHAASGSVLGTQSLTSQNTMAIIWSDGTNIYVK